MNKFKYYFILLITTISLFSCSKNDTATVESLRDYAVQFTTDNTDIEEYLKTNYITVVDHAGFADDQDITITKIPTGGTQKSIWDQTTYELKSRNVSLHDITYKMYYLVLRTGTGTAPCNLDGVLTAYKGEYLARETTDGVTTITSTPFEEVKYPQSFLSLFSTITGWGEIFPQFKTGTYSSNADGTVTHNDFGAGVMFIPSGLAYYSSGSGIIPSYAPLVFSFKLYEINRLDQDSDGIPSYQEDLNGDGYMRVLATGVTNPDDTDGDEIPNFLDVDDDGDNYTTKIEIKNPATGLPFPFADIPSCNGNTTDPARIKKHLDKACQ
ncbi:FKBP-type peptidylprolyl isomerase [Flavobacterium sp.]|uniref:FKBP-type peptidyl-prolyl cis-trans isomerase n=1 Tax=Flavobacterium sp. TaxID=239 RepID=UPI001B6EA367|nr:FKBP-type peptidylprolyl isomerase [Flavobacterium sp.]MBP6181405.1 FKBP-type peptidylprolyl isomerase [Flavobacterium sp.]